MLKNPTNLKPNVERRYYCNLFFSFYLQIQEYLRLHPKPEKQQKQIDKYIFSFRIEKPSSSIRFKSSTYSQVNDFTDSNFYDFLEQWLHENVKQ